MSDVDVEQPLKPNALREIEESLRGKLRDHSLSEAFIQRCGEEAVQRAFFEYLRARKNGAVIRNRDAFIVDVAFKRAMDELRREVRFAGGATVETILEDRSVATPPAEDFAIEQIAVAELRDAIGELSPEDRQLLSLHYFDELSAKRSAELLYLSERTYLRRLRKATGRLSRRLGVPTPEPGSDLAIEIGLIAWVSLRGAKVALAHGPIESVAAVLHDLAARLGVSGSAEKLGSLSGTPAGRIIGGCAGAAAVCVLGGTVGPGIGEKAAGLLGGYDPISKRAPAKVGPASDTRPRAFDLGASARATTAGTPSDRSTGSESSSRRRARAADRPEEEKQSVKEHASGFGRAEGESSPSEPSEFGSTSGAEPETDTAVVTPPASSTSTSPSEAKQAQQEFGAFK